MRSNQLRSTTSAGQYRRVRATEIKLPGRDLATRTKKLLNILMCSISLLITADFISGYTGLRLLQQIVEQHTQVCKLNRPLLKKIARPSIKIF
jgi:hypothetical protein